jgi:hypothetical protein
MELGRFIDHVNGPIGSTSVLVGNGSRLVERTKRAYGHQVLLYLTLFIYDFTRTLEPSLPERNHELAWPLHPLREKSEKIGWK